MLIKTTYTDHAAHDMITDQALWDIESFHVRGPVGSPRLAVVPADAKPGRGYMVDGAQVVEWTRTRRPRNSSCTRCERAAS